MKIKNKAFTLIELLVVIAIIGILATIVTTNVSTARVKARDATRKSDINQIAKALEMYYSEAGNYPVNPTDPNATNDISSSPILSDWKWLDNILVSKGYFSDLPKDPKNLYSSGFYYNYSYQNDSEVKDFYVILANKLENTNDTDTCGTDIKPKKVFTLAYMGGPYPCNNPGYTQPYKDSFGISNK